MPYQGIQFGAFRTQLAERLNDTGKVFHTDTELALHVRDALRFWNILTGDNKTSYQLQVLVTNPVWYDLLKIAGSPRLAANNDQSIYTRITAAILEPIFPLALQTSQFLLDDIVQATQRKRDEFLFRTGCTSTIETLAVSANTPTVALPASVIQPRRGYWLPQVIQGSTQVATPIYKLDEQSVGYYQPFAPQTPGNPVGFSAGIEPPLTIEIIPPPTTDGQVELITIESQGLLSSGSPTTLLIPNDFVPAIFWGAIADLFSIPFLARDDTRAAIARQRFEEYIELMAIYPFVFAARVNGVTTFVDSVENLDTYTPGWRISTANPNFVGTSGQNLVAFPTNQTMNIVLIMLADANLPVLDTDFIQLGDEVLDVVLDEAVSLAMFKIGGAEAVGAQELHKNIIRLAAKRNNKVRALSTFRDVLYGVTQREDQIAPREVANDVD